MQMLYMQLVLQHMEHQIRLQDGALNGELVLELVHRYLILPLLIL